MTRCGIARRVPDVLALQMAYGEVLAEVGGLSAAESRGKKREKLDKIGGGFEANVDRMRYHAYRAEGYPIATGVMEGACRHWVKDRMERAGLPAGRRWSPEGAQARLDLRSLRLSGQWDEFTAHRIRKETERLYPHARRHPRSPRAARGLGRERKTGYARWSWLSEWVERLDFWAIPNREMSRFDKGPSQVSMAVLDVTSAFFLAVAQALAIHTATIRGKLPHPGKAPNVTGFQHDGQRQDRSNPGHGQ